MNNEEPTLWDVSDVASYLKVSLSWVYHRAAANRLPHFRVGANLRFCPAEIRAYVRGTRPESARILPFTRSKSG